MQTFLASVLPTEGWYCVVSIKDRKVRTTFVDAVDSVTNAAVSMDDNGFDAYFALASFPAGCDSRSAENAQLLRCFFLDLDVGELKPYKTPDDALVALDAFLTTTGLPRPTIVNSGGGFHLYWPLTEDVPAHLWRGYARRLKLLCKQTGLHADPMRTADAASILRVPGTSNRKEDHPRPVAVLSVGPASSLDEILSCFPELPVEATAVGLLAAKQYGSDATTQAIAGGEHPPSNFAKIVRLSVKGTGCAQMKHAVVNAATLEEPLWRGVLSIASRCQDAATAIHKVSQEHPGYNAAETERKAAETKGPYTCEWYREHYPEGCKGCKQTVTSPIVLGRVVEQAPVVGDSYVVQAPQGETKFEIPAYPAPYFRGAQGGVFRRMTVDDETVDVEIYPNDLYITGRFFDSDEHGDGDGELVGINLHMSKDGLRRFYTSVAGLFSKDTLRDVLNKNGAIIYGKQLDLIMAYFASSLRKLQTQYAAAKTRNQMGWTPQMQGFVIGELEYYPHGTKLAPPASSTQQLAPAFTPRGSLDRWRNMANFYDRDGMEPHALALFFGFGAPLLKFIGGETVKGALVHLKSNVSGSGKTTVQMMINSIFGHPSELLMTQDDTYAAKMHRIGMLNSIAFTVDEVTNAEDKELSAMAYGFTTGRAKHRMEAQSNRMRANNTSWTTITITSSNASFVDKLAQLKSTADGELRRVLEIEVPRPENISKQEVDAVFGQLTSNYGVAGGPYIQYIVAHQPDTLHALREMQNRIDDELQLQQNDRFHSCILACAFIGASIAKQLGLHDIDIPRVYRFAVELVKQNKVAQLNNTGGAAMIAQETLAAYISENVNNALVVNSAGRGAPPQAPIIAPRGALKLRYEPNTQELFITAADFRAFFTRKQVDVRESLKALARAKLAKHDGAAIAKRISAGAVGGMSGLAVRCYVFDGKAIGVDETAFQTGTDGTTQDVIQVAAA